MCSYCGHVSKRPVLDLNSAGKVPRGWPCGQDCGSPYWPQLRCMGNNSFLGFARRLLSSFSVTIKWFLSKAFRFRSSEDSEADGKRLAKRGDNGGKAESRVDKAKRKAEEKRLARMEREMFEEEERKQRQEMAKLVEERRKLRDEKAEAEERSKGATPVGEKDARREADKRGLDRSKKEDKGSSKSNSDCEDMDRRFTHEADRKRDLDRKGDPERRDGNKPRHLEANSHTSKVADSKAKYFGRMAGGFLSSSRGFAGGSFFGRSAQAPAPQVNKVNRPIVPATDPSNAVKRDLQPASAQAAPKSAAAGETKKSWTNFNRPVSNKCVSILVHIAIVQTNGSGYYHLNYLLTYSIHLHCDTCRLVQMCTHLLPPLKSHGINCSVSQLQFLPILMLLLQLMRLIGSKS
jgi:hypothetical protein